MAENAAPQTEETSDGDRREDAYDLDRSLVERLFDALEADDAATIKALVADLR